MAKREVVINGGKVWFDTATGKVQGLQIWAKTEITGGGGGGHVGPSGGFTAPISIGSKTTVFREFWVVSPDGKERRIVYDEGLFSVRDGQQVSILWGASERHPSGPYLAILNRSVDNANIYRLSSNHGALLLAMGLKARWNPLLLNVLLLIGYLLLKSFGVVVILFLKFIICVATIRLASERASLKLWNAVFEEIRRSF